VPVGEAEKERWDVEDMVGMLGERFPRLGGEVSGAMMFLKAGGTGEQGGEMCANWKIED